MKLGIKHTLQIALVAVTAVLLIACDDGKSGGGNDNNGGLCVPSQANNFTCNPVYPGGSYNTLQGFLTVSDKGSYRNFLENSIGCAWGCDQMDNMAYIYLNLQNIATPNPSSGSIDYQVRYDNGSYAGNLSFGGLFYPSQNGTLTLTQPMVGGSVEFVVSIVDINSQFAPVQMFRVFPNGTRSLLASGNLQRNQPYY